MRYDDSTECEDAFPDGRFEPLGLSAGTLGHMRRWLATAPGATPEVVAEVRDETMAEHVDTRMRLLMATRADIVQAGDLRETWTAGPTFAPELATMLDERLGSAPGEGPAFLASLHADLVARVARGPYGLTRAVLTLDGDALAFRADRDVPPARKLGQPVRFVE